jgi:outer membrane PBP1 activator LpoA protein
VNPNAILPRTLNRTRRTALGLVLASIVLSGTLTACGSDAENTTCGDLKSKSTDDTLDFIKDAAEDDGSDNAKDAIKAINDTADENREALAKSIKDSVCGSQDDDTKLKDTDLYE